MEKIAVDLDKLLDDFELDEDESESVRGYDKVQLEFCPEARHGSGLGAFGGWSEPQAASWGAPGRDPHPPGDRSPPDGQNDDQLSANCLHITSSAGGSIPQPQTAGYQQPQPLTANQTAVPHPQPLTGNYPESSTSSLVNPPGYAQQQPPPPLPTTSSYSLTTGTAGYSHPASSVGSSQSLTGSSQAAGGSSTQGLTGSTSQTLTGSSTQTLTGSSTQTSTGSSTQAPAVSSTSTQAPAESSTSTQAPAGSSTQTPGIYPQSATISSSTPQVPLQAASDSVSPAASEQALWPSLAAAQASVLEAQVGIRPTDTSAGVSAIVGAPPTGITGALDGVDGNLRNDIVPTNENRMEERLGGDVREGGRNEDGGVRQGENRFEGLDVIASRPLDVIPATLPPDRGCSSGHETRHPDLIDVWQSGNDATGVLQPQREAELTSRQFAEPQEPQAEVPVNPDLRLLPDIMANNTEGGAEGPSEYPEPAIVMENALFGLQLNEPAIVQESQSMGRLPEVANVHQTTEQRGGGVQSPPVVQPQPSVSLDGSRAGCSVSTGDGDNLPRVNQNQGLNPDVGDNLPRVNQNPGLNPDVAALNQNPDVAALNQVSNPDVASNQNPDVAISNQNPNPDIATSNQNQNPDVAASNQSGNPDVAASNQSGNPDVALNPSLSPDVARSERLNPDVAMSEGSSMDVVRPGQNHQSPDIARLDEGHNPTPPGLENPPDVSFTPISFSKDVEIPDAELDAELAELEEEQSRLQGAYGGSLAKFGDSGTMGSGPDLIGGTGPHSGSPRGDSGPSQRSVDLGIDELGTSESGVNLPGVPAEERFIAAHQVLPMLPRVEEVVCRTNRDSEASQTNPGAHQSNPEGGVEGNADTGTEETSGASGSYASPENVGGSCGDAGNTTSSENASCPPGDDLSTTDTASSSSTLTDGELSPERRPQVQSSTTTTQHRTEGERVPVLESSPSRHTPGSLVTAVYDDDSGSGREDEGATRDSRGGLEQVGQVAPFWVPDEDASGCQSCGLKFTVIRRRHHCRACGRVMCATCCHHRAPLPYMDYKEARVCAGCLALIQSGGDSGGSGSSSSGSSGGGSGAGWLDSPHHSQQQQQPPLRPPDPSNPLEYCSRVPPPQQVSASPPLPNPTVMVPVPVLKREGSISASRAKQVIFSDGIRPGGDLTEGGGAGGEGGAPPPFPRRARRIDRPCTEYLPNDIEGSNNAEMIEQLRGDGPPVAFTLTKNLTVLVKLVKLSCCVGVSVWNVATRGLCCVGQEEVVVLLEVGGEGETLPPPDIFSFFITLYNQASQGQLVTALGHTIFSEAGCSSNGLLGSSEHGGFLYVRPTFQCLRSLLLPPPPYIFAILIQKWETPWAKVFPLRLMLRMGAEFRYYPCPLVSTRNRKPVFCEIGHTIMNLLVDFRNYSYTVAGVEGFVIHMEDKRTSLLIPRNRYDQVTAALSNSNDHVLALAGNFSPEADSHLVTIENEDGHYSTQAINIHNRPRKVTGASFIVFNGALKTTSGLSAKSSIVEDGLMVQIPADTMTKLRDALQNMKDFDIPCGPLSTTPPDEMVCVRWTKDHTNFNVGIRSPVDEKEMDGVASVKIHSGPDYVGNTHLIRWTEVFIIQGDSNQCGDVNLSRVWEMLSRSFCLALTPHLPHLAAASITRLALRTKLHHDTVEYEAGSGGTKLPDACMRDLDSELIPVIHRAAANITHQPIILELIFHILNH